MSPSLEATAPRSAAGSDPLQAGPAQVRILAGAHTGAPFGAIVVTDQLTKWWALNALDDGPISVIGDFLVLRLVRNPGAQPVMCGSAPRIVHGDHDVGMYSVG